MTTLCISLLSVTRVQTTADTRIKFLTDGMLLREAILDSSLSSYGMIILDEAHERTVNSDTLLALMKQIAT